MIVKYVRQSGRNCIASGRSVARYVTSDKHQVDVIGMRNLPMPTRTMPLVDGDDPEHDPDALNRMVAYADDPEKTGRGRKLIGADTIAAMEERAKTRPDIGAPWMHIVVSYAWADSAKLTDPMMEEHADGLVHEMVKAENAWRMRRAEARGTPNPKLVDADSLMWIACTHREKDHIHQHLLLCRIDGHGQAYSVHDNYLAARRYCAVAEEKHGLVRTEAPPLAYGHADARTTGAHREIDAIRDQVAAIMDRSRTREDLDRLLGEHGLRLEDGGTRGYSLVDAAGTRIKASRAGLWGPRNPDRKFAPTGKDLARRALWDAADESRGFDAFEDKLIERGYRADVDHVGRVARVRQLDARGKPVRGQSWTPRSLGMTRSPKRGDDAWWRGRPERKPRTPTPAPAKQQIRLVRQPTTMEALADFAAQRNAIRDRIEARDKARREADQATKTSAATAEKAADRSAGTQQEQDLLAGRVQRMHKFNTLTREPEALSDFMSGQGVAVSYDEKTRGWYAQQGQTVAALPFLGDKAPRSGWQPKTAASTPAPIPRIGDAAKPKADGPSLPRVPMPSGPKRDRGPRR